MKQSIARTILSVALCGLLIAGPIGCSLSDLQNIEKQIPVVESIAKTLVNYADPEYAPQVAAITATINGNIQALNGLLDNYKNNLNGVTPTDLHEIEAFSAALQAQLPQILPAAHVVDPESVKYYNAAVDAFNTVLLEVASLLPANSSTNAVRAQSASKVKILTAAQLKAQFNAAQNKVKL